MIDGSNKTGALNRVLELVRLSASKRTERGTAKQDNAGRSAPAAETPRDIAVLKTRLRHQVTGIDPDDEASAGKARKLLLREILVWEFGDAIRNHPEFSFMLNAVETAMAGNEATRAKFSAVIRDLQNGDDA